MPGKQFFSSIIARRSYVIISDDAACFVQGQDVFL